MLINNIRKSPTCPIRNTIHAPTRGATSAVAWKWKLHIISIHAPTRGATAINADTVAGMQFQSTLLQEERRIIPMYSVSFGYFNPRSYKRSDDLCAGWYLSGSDFNPRSYKRSDLILPALTSSIMRYFNPRSYKRSDDQVRFIYW